MIFSTVSVLTSLISATTVLAGPARMDNIQARAVTGVTGSAPGFATGTTGGGSAAPAYPSSRDQLVQWLQDSTPRVILINSEQNFIGTEGTTTAKGCRPDSNTCPGAGGQDAINLANWCTNGNAGPGVTTVDVTYDNAALNPIKVGSNKSLVGVGANASFKGKGLRLAGAQNVIIQNVHIHTLNPQYIWGGDGITLDGSDNVWVDHVKVSLVGRQMFVAGVGANKRVALTNSELDGRTSWSATCNGKHYWAIYTTGSNDRITMSGNYIHETSGRGPKVGGQGDTVLHVVNNYWSNVVGHAFDVETGGRTVIEGNVFENVQTPALNAGSSFVATSSNGASCSSYLGRVCQANTLTGSGSIAGTSTSAFAAFSGFSVAPATSASSVKANVLANAGVGKI
ncbi:polysaccharide lyase family 1 protein [Phaffia rhodozyma]|uniref:pectin lyase n=1 Tax=Phaffia rhodozyma TaxID=264483 RepID=A0A0F7SQC0_PHARH|nr:polysaccharide lyase family 1 protein [Phaffia rhodozyma]